ncbi:MAG: phosphotransferase family protein [Alphaproteobacteria bacterium]|nr:phosphotransferase family protein [Alphaproteobacteria bacterium]
MSEGTQTMPVRAQHRFDEDRLAGYLRDRLPDATGRLDVVQFAYGQSNPTYRLRFPHGDYVLRKKPPGELLPSAHQIDREYRVQAALAQTDVPVAKPILYCDDAGIVGTPFYLMQYMAGRVFTDSALPGVSPADRHAMYLSLAETLARLHRVDVDAVGLGDFGRPGNYYARQIARWSRNFRETKTRDIADMERLMDWLPGHVPEGEERPTIVHGDYRFGNVMFHPAEPRIVAIFDWEISTLGHPLADLAHVAVLYRTAPDEYWGVLGRDLAREGIPSEAEFEAAYRRVAGRADGLTPFHLVYALFRFAAILDGVRARGLAGNAAADNAEEIGRLALAMAGRAVTIIDATA